MSLVPPEPLRLLDIRVPADWIDYNGHMTEHRYLQCFGEATDALLGLIGVDAAYLAGGHSVFTVETHIMHVGQAHHGDALSVRSQVLGADGKRLHLFHVLAIQPDGLVVATAEQMLLHVDTAAARAVEAQGAVRAAMDGLAAAHAALPRPAAAGRHVGKARSR